MLQRTSQFAEPDLLNSVIVPLMENEMGAFPRGQEANQAAQVVALGEALALHQATLLKQAVRIEEAVCGEQDQVNGIGIYAEAAYGDQCSRPAID